MNNVITLNPNVGVAPGTTTMQLGEGGKMLYFPYNDLPQMNGLGGAGIMGNLGDTRWGLVLFAGMAAFLGVSGWKLWRRYKRA